MSIHNLSYAEANSQHLERLLRTDSAKSCPVEGLHSESSQEMKRRRMEYESVPTVINVIDFAAVPSETESESDATLTERWLSSLLAVAADALVPHSAVCQNGHGAAGCHDVRVHDGDSATRGDDLCNDGGNSATGTSSLGATNIDGASLQSRHTKVVARVPAAIFPEGASRMGAIEPASLWMYVDVH